MRPSTPTAPISSRRCSRAACAPSSTPATASSSRSPSARSPPRKTDRHPSSAPAGGIAVAPLWTHATGDVEGVHCFRARHRAREPLRGNRAKREAVVSSVARQGRKPHRLQAVLREGRQGSGLGRDREGHEHRKGEYVVLTDADFEKAKTPATEAFDIRAFVDADDIDFLYFDTPYYLAPSGKSGVKAYALLRDALEETGRVGVGTIVLRQREHIAALEPSGEALVLTTMRFAHEIRSAKELDLPRAKHGYQAREMKLARQLIETLSARWDPREFKDTYTDVLKKLIARKVAGEEITVPDVPERPKVTDLAQALRESLAQGRRPPAKMERRRAVSTGRSGTKHRKAA